MLQASSPGKVLILGGYLIVRAPNVGISIGVNARFTTRVVSTSEAQDGKVVVHIHSPQFGQSYSFECVVHDPAQVQITQTAGNKSPFLYYAILFAISAAVMRGDSLKESVKIELLADNDFYSQRNYLESKGIPVCVENLRQLPENCPLVGEVSKTGLGSSAAMTTSVVACIFSFYHGITEEQEFIHRIAQVAHSVAQGKIGSGFDVYTAVYGTCAYRRFPAEKVEAMMKEATDLHTVPVADLQACVDLKENWVTHVPFHLPSGIKLVLGDVHQGGSSTPGMVAKIMNWQKENAASKDNLWEQLRVNNEAYISSLQSLIQHSADGPEAYNAAVEKLSHVSRIESYKGADRFEESIVEACQFAANSRRLLREMGVAAGGEGGTRGADGAPQRHG
ncbi:phosphomevalonate kinase [Angomonas deanei]|nr:phosphomevalonate kinase [Angomonas deanei]|eukprot:EPY34012.1 phosphomevalonate kinase [Angomonas deanei]